VALYRSASVMSSVFQCCCTHLCLTASARSLLARWLAS